MAPCPLPRIGIVLLALACIAGCGQRSGYAPIDREAAVFWDRQTAESAQLLAAIVDDFNARHTGLPVRAETAGGYGDIFKKVSAGIQAGTLPALAVSYESMTAEYIEQDAAVMLDPYLFAPEGGLAPSEVADFFPAILESNRFEAYGGNYYSWPMMKSVLMLYFNRNVMREAGVALMPRTWQQFLETARTIKQETGKQAFALDMDASTFAGMVYSRGGQLYSDDETQFAQPASEETLRLIATLGREELAFQVAPGTFQDQEALTRDEIAFTLRTSAGLYYMAAMMEGRRDHWGVEMIPQGEGTELATVLFGPNVTLFAVGEEQQEAAWDFVRYFTSVDVQVRWALGTGYLPVRRSAADHPRMQGHFAEWEYNDEPFKALQFARPEPNVTGWQEVRGLVERAMTEVFTGTTTPGTAARRLKEDADAALARAAGANAG